MGEGVSSERIGQRVCINHPANCYECWYCRKWSVCRCENQPMISNGYFAQYAAVASRSAVEIPETLDLETAALTEPAACCLSGVEMLDIPYRATGLVIGAGVMGLFTAAFLKSHGVETLVVSEPVKIRREMAKQFGADILHDPNDVPLSDVIADVTDQGRGFSVTAEAVGKPELVATCINSTKPRGQTLMIGVSPEGSPLPVDLYDMHYREIKLIGAFRQGDVTHRVPDELAKLNLDNVISGRYPPSRPARSNYRIRRRTRHQIRHQTQRLTVTVHTTPSRDETRTKRTRTKRLKERHSVCLTDSRCLSTILALRPIPFRCYPQP